MPRHVEPRVRRIVKRTAHAQGARLAETRRLGEPAERIVLAQGRRGEDPRLGRARERLLHRLADVQRRLDQAHLVRADIHPAHRARIRRACEQLRRLVELDRALMQPRQVRPDLHDRRQRVDAELDRPRHLAQRRIELGPALAFVPAQLQHTTQLASAGAGQPQCARGALDAASDRLPFLQSPRMREPLRQQVASEVEQLRAAQHPAQEVQARLGQLMRLVEDRDLDAGQQLRDAAVAQDQVGEEQVMVDDDKIRLHRFAPRLHDVAFAVGRAIGAQAVVARRADDRDHRRALVQAVDLGEVAGVGAQRPALDARELRDRPSIRQLRAVARLLQSVQAEVTPSPLQQRGAQRQGEGVEQPRQVAHEELVLQALGRGADQGAAAAQQRRHQVREGLADAGPRLDDQRIAPGDRLRDGQRHALLRLARRIGRVVARQRTAGVEGRNHRLLELARPQLLGRRAGARGRQRRRRLGGAPGGIGHQGVGRVVGVGFVRVRPAHRDHWPARAARSRRAGPGAASSAGAA